MKFLCDVHISYKTVDHLNSFGYEAIHVNTILEKWFTSDTNICEYADANDFIVITKDSDFRNSFYINDTPKKLVKINLGNCSNEELTRILTSIIQEIKHLNEQDSFIVEVDKENVHFNLKN